MAVFRKQDRDISVCVYKKPVIIFSSKLYLIIMWNMEKFQFHLLTYQLEPQIFLRNVAPDILATVPW